MSSDTTLAVVGAGILVAGGYFMYQSYKASVTTTSPPNVDPRSTLRPATSSDPSSYQCAADKSCEYWSPEGGQYYYVDRPGNTLTDDPKACPNGWIWNDSAGCVDASILDSDKGKAAACPEGQYWNTNGRVCTDIAVPGSDVSNLDAAASGAGQSTAYKNYNDYIASLKDQTAVTPDTFGCFDTTFTITKPDGSIVSAKVCGDAASCYNEAKIGYDPDTSEYGAWGQKVDAGLATCAVLGGNQKNTVTFLNLNSIAQIYANNNTGGSVGQADLQAFDYSSWGTTVSWEDFENGKATYDLPANYTSPDAFKQGKIVAVPAYTPATVPKKGSYANGYPCKSDSDCGSYACARPNANTDNLSCCSKKTTFAFKDYSATMPNGTACKSDAMCSSGMCYGNAWGFSTGTCGAK